VRSLAPSVCVCVCGSVGVLRLSCHGVNLSPLGSALASFIMMVAGSLVIVLFLMLLPWKHPRPPGSMLEYTVMMAWTILYLPVAQLLRDRQGEAWR